MKRIKYFFLLLLLSSSAMGQGKFMYGINGGVNISHQEESYASSSSKATINTITPGWLGGLELDYQHSHESTFRLQVFVERKQFHEISGGILQNWIDDGSSGNYNGPYDRTDDFSFNYVESPLTLKVPVFGNDLQCYVFGGPAIGFIFSGHVKSNSASIIYEGDFGSSWVGLALYGGIGFSYSTSEQIKLFMEAGYSYGLNNFEPIFYHQSLHEFRIYFGFLFGK